MSVLAKQMVDVPFSGGIDTKTDQKLIMPANLTALENGVFSTGGALRKRNGFKDLVSLQSGKGLAVRDSELLLFGAAFSNDPTPHMHSYSPATGKAKDLGVVRAPAISSSGIYADTGSQTFGDCATNGGVTIYAYEESSSLFWLLKDETTGALITPPAALTDTKPTKPRCIAAGPYLFLFYLDGVGTGTVNLKVRTITPSNTTAGISAATTISAAVNTTTPYFNVRVEPNTGDFVMVYQNTSGDILLQVMSKTGILNRLGVNTFAGAVTVTTSVTGITALAVAVSRVTPFAPVISVIWSASTNTVQMACYNGLLTVTRAVAAVSAAQATSVVNITATSDTSKVSIFFEVSQASGDPTYNARVRFSSANVANSSFSESSVYRSVGLATEASTLETFTSGGFTAPEAVLVGVVYDDGTGGQSTVYFLDAVTSVSPVTFSVIGKVLVGRASGLTGYPKLPRLSQNSAGQWICALGTKNPLATLPGSIVQQTQSLSRVVLDFVSEKFRSAQINRNLAIAGASVSSYDGVQPVEYGFHVFPERPTVTNGNLDFSTLIYAKDAKGQTIQMAVPPDDYSQVPIRHSGARFKASQYFIVYDADAVTDPDRLVIWFSVDGVGTNPAASWGTKWAQCKVIISSTDDAPHVARAIVDAVRHSIRKADDSATSAHPAMDATAITSGTDPTSAQDLWFVNITTEFRSAATIPLPVDDSSFALGVYQYGSIGVTEKTRITCPAGKWISAGQWFVLDDAAGNTTAFYFHVDGSGSAPSPIPVRVVNTAQVSINSTDTPAQVATALNTAVGAVAGTPWTHSVAGPNVDTETGSTGAVPDTSGGGIRNNNVGGNLTAGTRYYYAIYEWTDAAGEYRRSATSLPVAAITGDMDDPGSLTTSSLSYGADPARNTNKTNIIAIPTLRLTRRVGSSVKIGLFRTQAIVGQLSGSVPAYRVTTLTNDNTVDSVSYTDTAKDADITSAEVLYTCSGELPNGPPPPTALTVNYANRLWCVDSEDPVSLWYSKPAKLGYAAEFGLLGLTSIRMDPLGGGITALGVMDDKLVIFKERRVYILAGDGPDVDGTGSVYGQPVLVTTDVGCTNPESIVLTKDGLLFQSAKGIYLLDRSGQVHPELGAPVAAFGTQSITSAILKPNTTEVVITSDTGTTLLWDYFYNQWGTFTGHQAVAAMLWSGNYVYLRSDGTLRQETPGLYTDAGAPIILKAQTSWLKMSGIQGFGRVYSAMVLGEFIDPHLLTMQFEFDYAQDTISEVWFDAGNAFATGPYGAGLYGSTRPYGGGDGQGKQYQFRGRPSRQKCEAVRLTLYDTPQAGGSASLTLTALSLEVGVRPGRYRRLSATRFSGQS